MLSTYYDLSLNGFKAPAKGVREEVVAGVSYVTALSHDALERKMDIMFTILMEKIEAVQPSVNRTLPELDSDDDCLGSGDINLEGSDVCSSWKTPIRPGEELLSPSEFDFLPQVKQADPLMPEPITQIKREGIEYQRLGMEGWNRIRYKEVDKLLLAAPVFSSLKLKLTKIYRV
ncbi:unnamed protein product, partial [Iphiclides podalirius]